MEFSALRNRAVGAMRNYFNQGYDAAALLGFAEDSPIIRTHLNKVYTTLFLVSMSSALGSYLCCTSDHGFIVAATVVYSMFGEFRGTPPLQENESKRIKLLCYGSFFAWSCVAPWLTWFLGVDESFVVSLLVGVCVNFGALRLALMQPNALAFVYFNTLEFSVIRSALGIGDSAGKIFWLNLCFIVYVVAYSQEVVLRVRGGDGDFVTHAVHLYSHFLAFLVNVIRGIWNMRRIQEGDD